MSQYQVRIAKRVFANGKWRYPRKPQPVQNQNASNGEDLESANISSNNSANTFSNESANSSSSHSAEVSSLNDPDVQEPVSILMDSDSPFNGPDIDLEVSLGLEGHEVMVLPENDPLEVSTAKSSLLNIPGIKSITPTQRRCSFCPAMGRKRIPFDAIFDAYIKTGIMIPQNNRCCDLHLDNGKIKPDVLLNLKHQNDHSHMTGAQVSKWLNIMRSEIITNRRILDFQKQNYDDSVYDMFLGLRKANFEVLHSECTGIRNSKNRCYIFTKLTNCKTRILEAGCKSEYFFTGAVGML